MWICAYKSKIHTQKCSEKEFDLDHFCTICRTLWRLSAEARNSFQIFRGTGSLKTAEISWVLGSKLQQLLHLTPKFEEQNNLVVCSQWIVISFFLSMGSDFFFVCLFLHLAVRNFSQINGVVLLLHTFFQVNILYKKLHK